MITSHFLSGLDTPFREDYLRSVMFVFVGLMVGILGEQTVRWEKNLRESESRNRTTVNSITDSILLINVNDFGIIAANSAALKKVKMEEGEVVGNACYEITHGRSSPCEPPDDIFPVRVMMETGRSITVEHTHYGCDGNRIYEEVSVNPVKDAGGRIVQMVHVARDISERKRLEEQAQADLIEMARLLAEAKQAKQTLLKVVEDQKRAEEALLASTERLRKGLGGTVRAIAATV